MSGRPFTMWLDGFTENLPNAANVHPVEVGGVEGVHLHAPLQQLSLLVPQPVQ